MGEVVLSTAGWKDVRKEAISKGEMVESVYDSIEQETPQYVRLPMFGKSKLFSQVGMRSRYTITRYLYCTVKGVSLFQTGLNWIGYIAHWNDSSSSSASPVHRILVVFRGTLSPGEWWKDLQAGMNPFPFVPTGSASVHQGFLSLYTSQDPNAQHGFVRSLREQMITELEALIPHGPPDVEIGVMGHSLGGALSTLATCDIGHHFASHGKLKVRAFIFGSPRVGNAGFKTAIERVAEILRFENIGDVVPSLPPAIPVVRPYVPVGTQHTVDWAKYSDKLKPIHFYSVRKKHDLELYMHGIALQPDMYSEETAYAEMGISKAMTKEQLENELAGNDPQARDELKSLEDAFLDTVWRDDESLHKHLLDCVYVARRQRGRQEPPPPDATVGRDYVLVNKWQDTLKDELKVPVQWWVHWNKDVRQDEPSGKWLPRSMRPNDQPDSTNPEFN